MATSVATALSTLLLLGALGTLSIFVNLYSKLLMAQDHWEVDKDIQTTFDFIVVGGGSAGAVLANRLSETYQVLLVEAGGFPNPLQSIPALTAPLLDHPDLDWKYVTTPQKHSCFGMINQQAKWPRGKSLGGTSNINYMIYNRGHPADYDGWANITGDPSWRYKNLLKYFKKSEDYSGQWSNEHYHSKEGELKVGTSPYNSIGDLFIKAGLQFGYENKDLNADAAQGGFSHVDSTNFHGQRWSTYNAFLEPIQSRATLHIYKYSHVTKVLLEDHGSRAYGVEYVRHGKLLRAFATKEVILSAGTMSTPQILMLSGIGPRKHLESFNITVHKDLPVGKNLRDHVASVIGPFLMPPKIAKEESVLEAVVEYLIYGTGLLSSGGVQSVAQIELNPSATEFKIITPVIQYLLVASGSNTLGIREMARSGNTPLPLTERFWGKAKSPFVGIANIALRPYSKGEARLQSTSPFVPLSFNPNYLADERDVAILVEGAKRAVEIIEKSEAFNGTRLLNESYPGCEAERFRSDEYWACLHRQLTVPGHHQVGTCSMGRLDSAQAVVDSKLRIIGVKNLRVVDGSVFPTLTSGNTNAPIIMIAEKTSDVIKKDWGPCCMACVNLEVDENLRKFSGNAWKSWKTEGNLSGSGENLDSVYQNVAECNIDWVGKP